MKLKKIVIVAASSLCFLGGIAFAGTLHNSDDHKYDLYITQPGSSVHTSIEGNTTEMSTCGGFPCTIKLVKTGQTVKLTSDKQNVEIKHGKLIVK